MGKPSRRRNRQRNSDDSKDVTKAARPKWSVWKGVTSIVGVVGAVGVVVGVFWQIYDFGSRISVEPLPAAERFNPTSVGRFKVTNEGKLAIYNVDFWCGVPKSRKPAGGKEWLTETFWMKPADSISAVESGQQFTAPCPAMAYITFDDGTKGNLQPLHVRVSVQYRPAYWFRRVARQFAFSSQPADKDGIEWIPRSVVDEFMDSTPVVESYTTPEQSR